MISGSRVSILLLVRIAEGMNEGRKREFWSSLFMLVRLGLIVAASAAAIAVKQAKTPKPRAKPSGTFYFPVKKRKMERFLLFYSLHIMLYPWVLLKSGNDGPVLKADRAEETPRENDEDTTIIQLEDHVCNCKFIIFPPKKKSCKINFLCCLISLLKWLCYRVQI